MEKYLIILVIIFVLYYAYTCWTSNKVEGFADAQSVVGVDDANAINTLAGIAKKLQEGGLTIPGSLSATGEIRAGGMVAKNATFGDGAGEWAQTVRLIGGTKEPPYIDFLNKDGARNTFIMGSPDKIYTPGSIAIGKDKIISGEGRLHVSGDELLYILNKSGVIIGKEWGGNGNLNVQGNIQVGSQTLTEDDIKRMKSMRSVAGWAIDGDGSTAILMEGDWRLNTGTMESWTCDKWDTAYIFKGWKITFWDGDNFNGGNHTAENKTEVVKKIPNLNNWPCSYKAEWVGY